MFLNPEYEYTEYLMVTNVLRENAGYCGSTVSVQSELKQQIYYFFIFSDSFVSYGKHAIVHIPFYSEATVELVLERLQPDSNVL